MSQQTINITTGSVEETIDLGSRIGSLLRGGEVLEMHSDVGGGKTTLIKGIAKGIGFSDDVMSPTFIVGAVYEVDGGLTLHHYDFYRINEPGIMREQLSEALSDDKSVIAVEWSGIVKDVLPRNTVKIAISNDPIDENRRHFEFRLSEATGYLRRGIQK